METQRPSIDFELADKKLLCLLGQINGALPGVQLIVDKGDRHVTLVIAHD